MPGSTQPQSEDFPASRKIQKTILSQLVEFDGVIYLGPDILRKRHCIVQLIREKSLLMTRKHNLMRSAMRSAQHTSNPNCGQPMRRPVSDRYVTSRKTFFHVVLRASAVCAGAFILRSICGPHRRPALRCVEADDCLTGDLVPLNTSSNCVK